MSGSIFRQAALDRLASPERLDAPPRLVGLPHWLLLGAFLALALGALAWAAATRAPVKIAGRGIVIDRSGLTEVVASDAGRVLRLAVAAGDTVSAGQPIALLAQSELDREIADTRARLAQAEARLARLQGFYADQGASEDSADGGRLASLARTRAELDRRRIALEERARRIAALVPRGFVVRDTLIAAEAEAAEARERIANLDNEAARLRVDGVARSGRYRLTLLDERTGIDQLQRTLARLEARAREQTVVRAQMPGQVVDVKVGAGDVVAPGSALVTLARGPGSAEPIALVYVPAGEGRRIQPGMAAELQPDTVERSLFGAIVARVQAVSTLPATREGMRRILRNDALVDQLLAAGPVTEVRLALARDPAAPTGFRWTNARGPDGGVGIGTLAGARVVIERRRVLDWLLPGSE